MIDNHQKQVWSEEFGKNYTDRNTFDVSQIEELFIKKFGISKKDMNELFLKDINIKDKRILEVGCNVGNQLILLDSMGYKNLYGIELQSYAVEKAKQRTKKINIIQGVADDIPYKDGFFNLVYTSNVLIHISPDNIDKVIDEIYRCSNEYIWGFEYYAENYQEVEYRENKDLLWKTDFAKLFINRFPDLELIKEKHFKYLYDENIDTMYLLRKTKS